MESQKSSIHSFPTQMHKNSFVVSVSVCLARSFLLGVLAVNPLLMPVAAAQNSPLLSSPNSSDSPQGNATLPTVPLPQDASTKNAIRANFGQVVPSTDSQKLADWVVDSADNGKLPFIIIDKAQAQVYVFNAEGQLRGASAALLGLAVGDHTVPGIGQRKLSTIRPAERTTPAGRFVAALDRDIHGEEVLWVDYVSSVSLHRVARGTPKERRLERLASQSPLDNRISYGCINVPVTFYENVVSPSFTGTNGIVYILPESRSAREVFGSYDVQDSLRKQP